MITGELSSAGDTTGETNGATLLGAATGRAASGSYAYISWEAPASMSAFSLLLEADIAVGDGVRDWKTIGTFAHDEAPRMQPFLVSNSAVYRARLASVTGSGAMTVKIG